MYDLITVGNISIDLFYKGKSLTFKNNRFELAIGGKYFTDNFIEAVGGGGANVAIGGAKLGLKSAILGKVSNNSFKQIILDKLKSASVSTKLCQFKNNYLNISTILYTETGEHTIINYRDKHQSIIESKEDYHKILQTKIVYMANLSDVSLTNKIEFLRYLYSKNLFTVVNLGVTDCRRNNAEIKTLLHYINILIVNKYEFADLVKAPYKDIHLKENIIKWYIPDLENKILIITCGKEGSYGYFNYKVNHQPAVNVNKIVNTVGAGDSYSAGFVSEYIKTKDIYLAMKKGASYSTKILSKIEAN